MSSKAATSSTPQSRRWDGREASTDSLWKGRKKMKERKRTVSRKIGHALAMLTATFAICMAGLISVPVSNIVSENASASGYPYNYGGDPYIYLGTGWNLVTFYGCVSFTAHNLFGMELNAATKQSIDSNWHNTIDRVMDFDAFGFRGDVWVSRDTFDLWHMHYHKIGADFSFQAGRAYWIHTLAPCCIYAPSYVNNGVMYITIHAGAWNTVGVIGEDGFWYEPEQRYKWASEMKWSLRYASNNTQYNGCFVIKFLANYRRTEVNITVAPPVDPAEESTWYNGAGGYGALEYAVFKYDSGHPYTYCNFAVSDPYYTDHMGMILWYPQSAGDLYWIFWPSDESCDSPWYST